jgi:hypothetical protein
VRFDANGNRLASRAALPFDDRPQRLTCGCDAASVRHASRQAAEARSRVLGSVVPKAERRADLSAARSIHGCAPATVPSDEAVQT